MLEMLLQKHKCEHAMILQGNPKEGALVTWDPEGKLAGEDTAKSKGPAEAKKNIAAGINAHKKTNAASIIAYKKNPCCAKSSQSGHTIRNRDDQYLCTYPLPSHPAIKEFTCFLFQGPLKGYHVVLEDVEAEIAQQVGDCHLHHTVITHITLSSPASPYHISTSTGLRPARPSIQVWVICRVGYLHPDPDLTMTWTKTQWVCTTHDNPYSHCMHIRVFH